MTEATPTRWEPAQNELSLVPAGLGPWRCKRLALAREGDELTVRFERETSSDWLEVVVFPRSSPRRAFRELTHCKVAYRGALSARSDEVRAQMASLVMAVGASVDGRLAERPGASIAEALGRTSEQRRLVFGRDALLGLLSPHLVEGGTVSGGFQLVDVYPTSYLRESAKSELELVLDFRRDEDGRRLLFEVSRRDDHRPALVTTHHFTVTHLSLGAAMPPGGDELGALVSFVLQLRDHEGLTVEFPDAMSDVARLLPEAGSDPDPDARDRVLNLAINSACGQSCTFCSVQDLSPPADGGDATYARLCADLESNRRQGVKAVRVNGYDPLTYGRIVDVLRFARSIGYESADVFSPCTRLADPAFCREIVESLPPLRRFHVPVYGASADVHDGVVGTKGAFDLLSRALANLRQLLAPGEIVLIGVATRGALEGLVDAAKWASSLGLELSAHMPYPSSESKADRFFTSVPRQTDVADRMAHAAARGVRLAVHGVAPCVTFRRMQAGGIQLTRWLPPGDQHHPLPGTEYRQERFVHRAPEAGHSAFHAPSVACPHVGLCALSGACPRELSSAYLKAFGADEFVPVSIAELLAAAQH